MGRLSGKVAIITGAASGMGEATAELMAKEGASILVADINLEGAQRVAQRIVDRGGAASAQYVDISDPGLIEEMVAKAKAEFGRLDVLHSNAARLNFSGDVDVVNMDIEQWDANMVYNLRSVMLGASMPFPSCWKRAADPSSTRLPSAASWPRPARRRTE